MGNKCVNINMAEFKELAMSSGIDALSLASDVSIWQDQNNVDVFPSIDELYGKSFPGGKNIKPVQKRDQKELDTQTKGMSAKAEMAIKKALKPSVKMNFISDTEFLKYENARELRSAQKDIKKEYATLNSLIECLIK